MTRKEKLAAWWVRWSQFVFVYLAVINGLLATKNFTEDGVSFIATLQTLAGLVCWYVSIVSRLKELDVYRRLAIHSYSLIKLVEEKNELE